MNITTYYVLLKCKKCGKIIGKLTSDDGISTNRDTNDDSVMMVNKIRHPRYGCSLIINCIDCVGE